MTTGTILPFMMTHPAVVGPISVAVRWNRHGTGFYTARTESGVLINQMTFAQTETELRQEIRRAITKRLS